ncbi:hypothetical protein [Halomontanus rarus]|uniref:hypothetical protein n=1 Tax=Halomontanus rarus TaxID=3034020 RepID=UPI0023E8A52A|nr:hypothetical protein [Halovivax sp. TS33]
MNLSPEEYGSYWRASIRLSAGVLLVVFGYRFVTPLFAHSAFGAQALGFALFVAIVAAGSFLAVLGLARAVRTAVDAEMRR